MPGLQYVLWPVSRSSRSGTFSSNKSHLIFHHCFQCRFPAACISAPLFALVIFFPALNYLSEKQACEHFCVVLTGSCSPAGRSWNEGLPYSLQMVKSSSSVLPTQHLLNLSPSLSCFLLSALFPLSLLDIPRFSSFLLLFSSISLFVFCPLWTYLFEEVTGQSEDVEEGRVSERRRDLPMFGQGMRRVGLVGGNRRR